MVASTNNMTAMRTHTEANPFANRQTEMSRISPKREPQTEPALPTQKRPTFLSALLKALSAFAA